jgi:hypothetical protein
MTNSVRNMARPISTASVAFLRADALANEGQDHDRAHERGDREQDRRQQRERAQDRDDLERLCSGPRGPNSLSVAMLVSGLTLGSCQPFFCAPQPPRPGPRASSARPLPARPWLRPWEVLVVSSWRRWRLRRSDAGATERAAGRGVGLQHVAGQRCQRARSVPNRRAGRRANSELGCRPTRGRRELGLSGMGMGMAPRNTSWKRRRL